MWCSLLPLTLHSELMGDHMTCKDITSYKSQQYMKLLQYIKCTVQQQLMRNEAELTRAGETIKADSGEETEG